MPSLLVFGPQASLSPEHLTELRSRLISNSLLSKLLNAAQDLQNFWSRLVRFDAELQRVPGECILRDFAAWLAHAGPFPYFPSELPVTLSFPINFLFQIAQYCCLAQSMSGGDVQRLMVERLEHQGVQGFCVGFLCAITVASSYNEGELIENAIRALRLAVCIGAYVDNDAIRTNPKCIGVRGRRQEAENREDVLEILQDFPEVCVFSLS